MCCKNRVMNGTTHGPPRSGMLKMGIPRSNNLWSAVLPLHQVMIDKSRHMTYPLPQNMWLHLRGLVFSSLSLTTWFTSQQMPLDKCHHICGLNPTYRFPLGKPIESFIVFLSTFICAHTSYALQLTWLDGGLPWKHLKMSGWAAQSSTESER